MKDLKSQFDEYQAPVTEQSWDSIAQDAAVVRHNRMCKLRKAGFISATTAVIAAAVIIVIGLSNTSKTTPSHDTAQSVAQETRTEQIQQPAQEVAADNIVTETNHVNDNNVVESAVNPAIVPAISTTTTGGTSESANVPVSEKSIPARATAPVIENKSTVPASKTISTTKAATPVVQNTGKAKSTPAPVKEQVVTKASPTTPAHPEPPSVKYELFIPNSFTPNGDGINDIFKPVADFPVTNFEMSIYSRSGDRMFTSRNIEGGWDGQKYGTMTQDGVYLYIIKYIDPNGDSHTQKGQVVLFK